MFCVVQAPAPGTEAACTLTTELEQGPYWLDDIMFRSNITENQEGVPLLLRIKVANTDCEPLADVFVDIWHCNATGFYSGFTREQLPLCSVHRRLSAKTSGLCAAHILTFKPVTVADLALPVALLQRIVSRPKVHCMSAGMQCLHAICVHAGFKAHDWCNSTGTDEIKYGALIEVYTYTDFTS